MTTKIDFEFNEEGDGNNNLRCLSLTATFKINEQEIHWTLSDITGFTLVECMDFVEKLNDNVKCSIGKKNIWVCNHNAGSENCRLICGNTKVTVPNDIIIKILKIFCEELENY